MYKRTLVFIFFMDGWRQQLYKIFLLWTLDRITRAEYFAHLIFPKIYKWNFTTKIFFYFRIIVCGSIHIMHWTKQKQENKSFAEKSLMLQIISRRYLILHYARNVCKSLTFSINNCRNSSKTFPLDVLLCIILWAQQICLYRNEIHSQFWWNLGQLKQR